MLLSLFRPPRPPQPQPIPPDLIHILAALRQDVADIADAVIGLRDGLAHLHRGIHHLRGDTMANFDALNAKLDEQAAAMTAATDRINADVADLRAVIEALELDADDQAKVDAVTARIQESVDALNAIDPVVAGPDDDSAPTSPQA